MNAPLADQMRPQTIDEVVGQNHILSKNGILYRIAQSGHATNLIFYGPPGTGKTTVARIIAKQAGKKLYKLNGTTASTADFKEIISSLDTFEGMNGVVLYLDEIQYLNKKQQQTLLEFLENGQITLIASTTENPYFYIYNAIISRSTVFEFKPVTPEEIEKALARGVKILEAQAQEQGFSLTVEDHVLRSIALSCGGDVRKSINTLEVAFLSAPVTDGVKSITAEQLRSISQRAALRYDKSDDVHYDLLSALQKSIRGSDENAALHYLARLLEAGDLISPLQAKISAWHIQCVPLSSKPVWTAHCSWDFPKRVFRLLRRLSPWLLRPNPIPPIWRSIRLLRMSVPEKLAISLAACKISILMVLK